MTWQRRATGVFFVCVALASAGVLVSSSGTVLAGPKAAASESLIIGPYVQSVTPDSAVVCWATEKPGSESRGKPVYAHHEKAMTHLQPGTTYPYDVLGGAPEGKGTVTTFPSGNQPFRFVAYGDTRTRSAVQQRIVDRAIAAKPLFVVNTGDLVSNGRVLSQWVKFFHINHELMRNTLYVPVLGNHERNAQTYFDFFRLPGNKRYYDFTVGDAAFLVLDSEGPNGVTADGLLGYMKQQKAWVESALEKHNDAAYIFVTFHEPLYSVMSHRQGDTRKRREFWGDIFERHKVQVLLCGHDHHYHHAFHGGTHYITTGGGGAPLYNIDAIQPETVKAVKVEHYLIIDVAPDKATIRAIDIKGNLIDKFDIAPRTS